jgi:hypothetical protein
VPDLDHEPERCEACGSTAFRPATPRERLQAWFAYGRGGGDAWECTGCGASWSAASSYVLLRAPSGLARRLRLPWDVFEALRAARHWHPVPRFYAIVGLVALVPAALVAVVGRSRWWAALFGIPVGAMVAAFLWSLTSGLGPAARRDVLMRVAPTRAWARELEEELADLRREAGRIGLLAPVGWDGQLTVEGRSWSVSPRGRRELTEAAVVADRGDPAPAPARSTPAWSPPGPRVEVRVTRDPIGFPDEQAVVELVDRTWQPPPPDPEELEDLRRAEARRRLLAAVRAHDLEHDRRVHELAASWRTGTVRVDGEAVPARLLTDGDAGVATFGLGDGGAALVVAVGVAVDGLALARVTDPGPLLTERAIRQRRLLLGEEVPA